MIILNYGRIIRDENDNLLKIVEEKIALMMKKLKNGILVYIFQNSKVFEILNNIKTNNAKEYYLTDAIGLAQQSKMEIKAIQIANSNEVVGVNTADQ